MGLFTGVSSKSNDSMVIAIFVPAQIMPIKSTLNLEFLAFCPYPDTPRIRESRTRCVMCHVYEQVEPLRYADVNGTGAPDADGVLPGYIQREVPGPVHGDYARRHRGAARHHRLASPVAAAGQRRGEFERKRDEFRSGIVGFRQQPPSRGIQSLVNHPILSPRAPRDGRHSTEREGQAAEGRQGRHKLSLRVRVQFAICNIPEFNEPRFFLADLKLAHVRPHVDVKGPEDGHGNLGAVVAHQVIPVPAQQSVNAGPVASAVACAPAHFCVVAGSIT